MNDEDRVVLLGCCRNGLLSRRPIGSSGNIREGVEGSKEALKLSSSGLIG